MRSWRLAKRSSWLRRVAFSDISSSTSGSSVEIWDQNNSSMSTVYIYLVMSSKLLKSLFTRLHEVIRSHRSKSDDEDYHCQQTFIAYLNCLTTAKIPLSSLHISRISFQRSVSVRCQVRTWRQYVALKVFFRVTPISQNTHFLIAQRSRQQAHILCFKSLTMAAKLSTSTSLFIRRIVVE